MAERSTRDAEKNLQDDALQAAYAAAYHEAPYSFRDALAEARDFLGERLAMTWRRLSPADLTFSDVARAFLTADRQLSGMTYQDLIVTCFHWREIGLRRPVQGLLKSK